MKILNQKQVVDGFKEAIETNSGVSKFMAESFHQSHTAKPERPTN